MVETNSGSLANPVLARSCSALDPIWPTSLAKRREPTKPCQVAAHRAESREQADQPNTEFHEISPVAVYSILDTTWMQLVLLYWLPYITALINQDGLFFVANKVVCRKNHVCVLTENLVHTDN